MQKNSNYIKKFLKDGYFIYDIKNLKLLDQLKNDIFLNSKKIISTSTSKKNFFNNFHNLEKKIGINEFRMKLMSKMNLRNKTSEQGYSMFSDIIQELFGSDIVTQKNANLVIQEPNDISQITVHRDAPPNSDYEIVVWLPLENTYKSKNMFIMNKEKTSKLINIVNNLSMKKEKKEKIMDKYYSFAFKNAKKNKIKYGQALLFWTALIHCVPKNIEKETRWSLNFRFKNTFTPYGTKGFPDYFKVISKSPVTKLAIEKEEKKFK